MKSFIKGIAIFFIVLFGFLLFIFSNRVGGFRAFTVLSASMQPNILTGSVVVTRYIHPRNLQEKDIITFIAPTRERQFVTHRIAKITQNDDLTTLKTKGDNNKKEDGWTLAGGGVVGKIVVVIPYLGYFMSFVQSKIGIILFVLLPALYIIVNEIFNTINTVKSHRKKNEKAQEVVSLVLAFFIALITFSTSSTYALLSDSALLTHNSFTIDVVSDIPIEFPSCTAPQGRVISSYETGSHEIIGVGLLQGSDIVYQLAENSKGKVMQCYCPQEGPGIQTNWLKTTELGKYRNNGWPYSINSGLSWNLDDSPYVAQNIEYTCN